MKHLLLICATLSLSCRPAQQPVTTAETSGPEATAVANLAFTEGPTVDDAGEWLGTFARQCREHIEELLFLAPWLALGPAPAALADALPQVPAHAARLPTLRELAEENFDAELQADAALPTELDAGQTISAGPAR